MSYSNYLPPVENDDETDNRSSTFGRLKAGITFESVSESGRAFSIKLPEMVDYSGNLEIQAIIARNMQEGVCLVRVGDGVIIYANPRFEQLFGYDPGELNGQPVYILNYSDAQTDPRKIAESIMAQIAQEGQASYEVRNIRKDGTAFWCRATASVFEHPSYGQLFVVVQEDITACKQAETALLESKQRFQAIFNQTFQFIGLLSPDGTLLEANQTALDFGGLQPADVLGKPFWQARWWQFAPQPDTVLKLQQAIKEAARGKFVRYEVEVRGAGETTVIIDFSLKPVFDEQGQVSLIIPEGRDITEHKRAEQLLELRSTQLQASLAEKEVLLREVHHRVKNNLQIISSLLYLEAEATADQNIRNLFRDSQERVRSMALIHEQLYSSANLAQLDFATYVQQLITNLFEAYGVKPQTIKLNLEIEPLPLSIDAALNCGLIVHELISNSLKYAFPQAKTAISSSLAPAVGVELKILRDNSGKGETKIILLVWDNGIGLPPKTDFRQTSTLGLQLVCILVQQLDGSIDLLSGPGTRFSISFNDPDNKLTK
jgi:PAS domain S-box-containing protein